MVRDHVPGVEEVLDGLMVPPEEELLLAFVVEVVGLGHSLKIFAAFVRPNEEEDSLVDTHEGQQEAVPPDAVRRHIVWKS